MMIDFVNRKGKRVCLSVDENGLLQFDHEKLANFEEMVLPMEIQDLAKLGLELSLREFIACKAYNEKGERFFKGYLAREEFIPIALQSERFLVWFEKAFAEKMLEVHQQMGAMA